MKRTLRTTAWLSLLVASLLTSGCFFDGSGLEDRECNVNLDCTQKIDSGTLAAPGRGLVLACQDAVCQTEAVTCNDTGLRSIFNNDGTILTPNRCASQVAEGDYGLAPAPAGQEYICAEDKTCALQDLPTTAACQGQGARINLARLRATPPDEGTEEPTSDGTEILCPSGTVAFFLPDGEDANRCDAVCCADSDDDGAPDDGTNDCAAIFQAGTDCNSRRADARPDGMSFRVNGATAGMTLDTLPEDCDGADNDCDGTVDGPVLADQDTTGRCEKQGGVCAGSLKACVSGRYRDCTDQDYIAQKPAYLPAERYCTNGINPTTGDCMGGVVTVVRCTEGYNPTTGGCTGNASEPLPVTPEQLCDGVDNDCDGMIDPAPTRVEGVIQPGIALPCYPDDLNPSDPGSNFCQMGLNTCTAGAYAADCPTCALTQDDDGSYDLEAYDACLGEFKAVTPLNEDSPLLQCGYGSADGARYMMLDEDCDAPNGAPGAELACQCDADVTCYAGPDGTSGTGTCVSGLFICDLDAATLDMTDCVGDIIPASETCADAAADNDCDGSTAELLDGAALTSVCRNTGNLAPCGAAGREFRCEQTGEVFCTNTAAQTGGLVADEPCTLPGLQGECARGRLSCGPNGITCDQVIFPEAETCDDMGIDNDCDGATDDLDVRAPLGADPDSIPSTLLTNIAPTAANSFRGDFGECTTAAVGRCAQGRWACETVAVEGVKLATCINQEVRLETGGNINGNLCDGVDDDCDGMTDENCPNCTGPGMCN